MDPRHLMLQNRLVRRFLDDRPTVTRPDARTFALQGTLKVRESVLPTESSVWRSS